MDEQTPLTVCRLCFKDVEANTSCFPITNNSVVLQNLNLISFATIRNLQLTDEPVLCEICEEKLKKLAYFKENVITNEFKIQCHQKREVNFFLQTLSTDIDQICRLCLRISSHHFDKTWKDNKKLFVKCNIHLNLNIAKPSKMCDECYKLLNEIYHFVCDLIEKEKFLVSEYSLKKKTLRGKDLVKIFTLQKLDNGKAVDRESHDTSDVIENNNNLNDDENLDFPLIDNKSDLSPISHNVTTQAPLAEEKADEMSNANAANALIAFHEKDITVTCEDSSKIMLALSENSEEQLFGRESAVKEQQEVDSDRKGAQNKKKEAQIDENQKTETELQESTSFEPQPNSVLKKASHEVENGSDLKEDLNSAKAENLEGNSAAEKQELSALIMKEKKLNKIEKEDGHNKDTSAVLSENENNKTVLKASNDIKPKFAEEVSIESDKCIGLEPGRDWSFLEAANQDLTNIFSEVPEHSDMNDMYKVVETEHSVEINVSVTTNCKLAAVRDRNEAISPTRQELIDLLEGNVKEPQVSTLEQLQDAKVEVEEEEIPVNKIGRKTYLGRKGIQKKDVQIKAEGNQEIGEVSKEIRQKGENKEAVLSIRVSSRKRNIKDVEVQHKSKRETLKKGSPTNNLQARSNEKQNGKRVKIESVDKEISPEIRKSPRTKVTKDIVNKNKKLNIESKPQAKGEGVSELGRGRRKKTAVAKLKFDESVDNRAVSDFTHSTVTSTASNLKKKTQKTINEAVPAQKRTKTKIEGENVQAETVSTEENPSASTETPASVDNTANNSDAGPEDGADCEAGEGGNRPNTFVPVVNGLRIIRRTNRSNSEAEKKWMELISGTSTSSTAAAVGGAEAKQARGAKMKTRKRRARESTPVVEFVDMSADATPPPTPTPVKVTEAPKKYYEKALMCDRCQYRTKSRDMLTQHQLIHNLIDSVKKFRCKSCSFQAKSQELLDQHKLTHLDVNATYKCVYCEFKAKKKVSLLHHIIRHEDKPVNKEFFCSYINCDESTEAYECLQCEFQSSAWDTLVSHVADHEATNTCNPNIEMFKCSFCSYKTKTEELLSRHEVLHKFHKYIKKSDESDTLLKCDRCSFATVNKRSLQNHFSKKHGVKEEKKAKPQSDELFYCAQCPYLTDRKPNITRHVLVHMTKKNIEFWECPHCPFETKHRRSYIRHMVCVHNVVV